MAVIRNVVIRFRMAGAKEMKKGFQNTKRQITRMRPALNKITSSQQVYEEWVRRTGNSVGGLNRWMRENNIQMSESGKMINRTTGRTVEMADAFQQAQKQSKRFRFEMLSVMFFGMAMQNAFGGMTQQMLKTTGATDALQTAMMTLGVKSSAGKGMYETMYGLTDSLLDLDPATQDIIGSLGVLTETAGGTLARFGMMSLGIQGLMKWLPGLGDKLAGIPGMGGLASLIKKAGEVSFGVPVGPKLKEGAWTKSNIKNMIRKSLGTISIAVGIGLGATLAWKGWEEENPADLLWSGVSSSLGIFSGLVLHGMSAIPAATIALPVSLAIITTTFTVKSFGDLDEAMKNFRETAEETGGNYQETAKNILKSTKSVPIFQRTAEEGVKQTQSSLKEYMDLIGLDSEELREQFRVLASSSETNWSDMEVGFVELENKMVPIYKNLSVKTEDLDEDTKNATSSLNNLPSVSSADIYTNADKVQEELDKLKKTYEDLDGTTIETTIIQDFQERLRENTILGGIVGFLEDIPGGLASILGPKYQLSPLQEGGIVTQPTTALIGEAGPEAVIPLNKVGTMGGNNVNASLNIDEVNINESGDIDEIARELGDRWEEEIRARTGGL